MKEKKNNNRSEKMFRENERKNFRTRRTGCLNQRAAEVKKVLFWRERNFQKKKNFKGKVKTF